MTDTREQLRAARDRFDPPNDVLESIHRRRERHDRVRRRTTVAVSLSLFLGLVAGLAISIRTAEQPADTPEPIETTAPSPRGVFSGLGGWITFQTQRAYRAVAPDGSEQTVLLDGRKDLWAQDWSPDGSRLLVALDDAGGSPWDLAVIEPDGSVTTLLETSRFDGASFSADGARVVYAKWAGAGQLWTVASDGSEEPRLLLESNDLLYQPTYSPDGRQIAFVEGGGDHSHTIRVVDADGTHVRVLIEATPPFDGASHISGLEWSPDGSLIAVGLGDGGEDQGIYTVRPDGTGLRLLIPSADNPAWSPNGSLIAYSPYDPNHGVWVANADGSDPRMLSPSGSAGPWNPGAPADSVETTGGPASEPPPSETTGQTPRGIFSYIGGWIAFEYRDVTRAVAPDGSEQTVLLDGRKDLWALDWSPNGSRLLVWRGGELAVLESDGSETTLVLDDKIVDDTASFSPDGARVIYSTLAKGGQLLTIASDGSGKPRKLLGNAVFRQTFSPDGTRIAYQGGWGDHDHTIGVMNADGTDVRVLIDATPPFDDGHINGLEWSPTGSLIAVGLGGDIYTINQDGTGLSLLIPEAGFPSWSPDGSLIAYTPLPAKHSGVWVANADGSDPRMLVPYGVAGPWNPGAPAYT